jgi:hypothetical protein
MRKHAVGLHLRTVARLFEREKSGTGKKDEAAFIGFVYLFFCRKRQILKCGAEKWIDFNVIRLLFFANYGSGAINSGSGSLEIDGID